MAVAVAVDVAIPVVVWLFAAVFVSIPRLGALLDGVSPVRSGRPLARLDSGYLMDLDLGLRRMLNMNVHQGRVERHLLIGQRQRVHGLRWRFSSVLSDVLVVGRVEPGGRRGRQVTKLPRRVGRTPAEVSSNATTTIQTGELAEEKSEALVLGLLLV